MSEKKSPAWRPTGLIQKAFELAAERHKDCVRKGTDIPYICHLLAVSALVIESGGDETQAAAALLHDVIEDTPTTYAEVETATSTAVADIVKACTSKEFDRNKDKSKIGEQKRLESIAAKRKYLEHLRGEASDDPSLLVALADKVHNSETCVNEYPSSLVEQKEFWKKFNVGYEDQLKWYTQLLEQFETKGTISEGLMIRLRKSIRTLFYQPQQNGVGDDFSIEIR